MQGGCSEDFARDPLVLSRDPHLSSFILRFLGVFWDGGGSGMGGRLAYYGLVIE